MTGRMFLAAVALILAAVAPAQADWPDNCKFTRMAQLPMTLAGNHVTVPVQINGVTKDFLLDTGGYASEVTAAVSTDLHLKGGGIPSERILDIAGKAASRYVRPDTFAVGDMVGKHLPLLEAGDLGDAEGILAPDVLRRFDVELDFAKAQMSLYKYHPCNDYVVYWTSRFTTIDFDITDDGHIRVPVTLDGKETHAILDTGAESSGISMSQAGNLFGLDAASPGMEKAGQATGGQGGTVETWRYPFKTLTIGGIAVGHPRIHVSEGHNFLGDDGAAVLLGMDVIRHLHLYIAYHERRLYVSGADVGMEGEK